MSERLLSTLRHHPFVAEFEPRHVEKLASLAREIRFERDQILFREGDECTEFYLIVTGLIALEIVAPGHTFRVQTLFAGDELGWSALLMGRGKLAHQFSLRFMQPGLFFKGGIDLKKTVIDGSFFRVENHLDDAKAFVHYIEQMVIAFLTFP